MIDERRSLSRVLEAFNRKERNLLVRDILGHAKEKLELSNDFRSRLSNKLGITVERDAWWATDYHFNWLIAGLTVYYSADGGFLVPFPDNADHHLRLIKGSQEDVDLIVMSGQELILIEAKAHEAWSNKQAARKRERFDLVKAHNRKAAEQLGQPNPVNLHFLLMSPAPPSHLQSKPGEVPFEQIIFNIDRSLPSYRVIRCNASAVTNKEGGHWCVVQQPPAAPVDQPVLACGQS